MSDEDIPPSMNEQLVLISGESGSGKSASLRNIRDQNKWIYNNTEAGKRLPFKNSFITKTITDPYEVPNFFEQAMLESNAPHVNGMIIDTITFLMDMMETQYVINSSNTMKGWADYQQYFKDLLQNKVARFAKPVIILGHTKAVYNEKAMEFLVSVPIKGALANNGVEAYFSTVVSTKKISITDLEKYQNELLNITEEERDIGYKHVFQTRPTKNTTGERIRAPMGLFTKEQTYIDNDAQLLLDHLHKYYS